MERWVSYKVELSCQGSAEVYKGLKVTLKILNRSLWGYGALLTLTGTLFWGS